MNLITRLTLAVAVAGLSALSLGAEINHVRVDFTDGNVAYIAMPYGADIQVGDKSIAVVQSDGEVRYTYEAEMVSEISFVERELTAISDVAADGSATVITPLGDGLVKISSGRAVSAAEVCVYDLSGRRLPVEAVSEGESLVISLRPLAAGVYIVNHNNTSIKVTKK